MRSFGGFPALDAVGVEAKVRRDGLWCEEDDKLEGKRWRRMGSLETSVPRWHMGRAMQQRKDETRLVDVGETHAFCLRKRPLNTPYGSRTLSHLIHPWSSQNATFVPGSPLRETRKSKTRYRVYAYNQHRITPS